MEDSLDVEMWNKQAGGILTEVPLLLIACKEGSFGPAFPYPGGCVYKALFTYLAGKADGRFFAEHPDLFYGNWLVCMSSEWETYIKALPLQYVLRREVMVPLCAESAKQVRPLPEGYRLSPFTPEIFETHPFGHGIHYADFQDFSERGAGAVVLYDGHVVAAASSFLTFEKQVELDISTDPGHRRRGLADQCTAEVMRQCCRKKLAIHWDAQNPLSATLAKSHGFQSLTEYAVYCLAYKGEN